MANTNVVIPKFKRGVDSALASAAIEQGTYRVTTDTGRLLIDLDGSRIEITDFVKKTESEIKAIIAPLMKFYYATDTHKIYVYDDGWKVVGSTAASADKLTTSRSITLKGDVSGTGKFDGSKDLEITTEVADDSHSHTASTLPAATTSVAGVMKLGASGGAATYGHTHSAMKAATSSAAGAAGMVPAPAKGDQNKVLSGAGTWISQTPAYTHPTSGVTAGTYKSVTVNAQGHVTSGSNPTTLEGYGITDAAAKTHSHEISDITNLQTTLDSKASTSHNHDSAYAAKSHSHGAMTGATSSAAGAAGMVPAPAKGDQNKVLSGAGTWVAQTAAYTHPTSGVTAGTYKSVTVNAQGHVTAGTNPTTLSGYGITDAASKDHTHSIANVTGLQDALDAKAAKSHTHAISDITNLQTTLNGKAASSHTHSAMTAATASAAGAAGFVPAPAAGDQNKVLSGSGKWVAQTSAYTHPTSGVTAGTYRSVTVNAQGHVTAGTNPTTLNGYGITDAAAKNHSHKRVAMVGSDTASSAGWYKVADQTMSGYGDSNISFMVTSTYGKYYTGLLVLQMRSDNTSISCRNLIWLTRNGFAAGDVMVVVSGMKWTLYAKQTNTQYGRLQFEIISEGNIAGTDSNVTLYSTTTKESTDPTATVTGSDGGYVKYATKAGSLNVSAAIGSTKQPVYIGANGIPVALGYTIEKSVPSNAVFTDTNTWRDVVDNLTSDDATKSLTAKQGKVLKGLVDGKAASNHNHDTVYAAKTHTHAISEVTNLQTTLDGKAAKSHSHDASSITSGVFDIARIPKAAISFLKRVADDTARFALTTSDIQNGDSVKVESTGKMYYVIDETKLSSEDGYEPYTADAAASVPWSGVTDKPSTFTPSSHTHAISDITNLQTTLNGKAASSHTHTIANITNLQTTLDSKASTTHNHDSAYAAKSHSHAISDVTNLQTTLDGKAATSHNHDSAYAAKSHSHGAMTGATSSAAGAAGFVPAPKAGDQVKVLSGAGTWIAQTAAYTHPTSGVTAGTYRSVTVNAQGHVTAGTSPTTLSGYGITDAASKTHTHAISDVTNLQTTLDGKASTSHNHDSAYAAKSHSHSAMTAATASAAGAAGFVPAPKAGDQNKVLTGAGTWVAQTAAYTHPTSGVTAGTYRSVTVNAQGHVTAGTSPTTLAGYGITDAANKSHTHAIANVTGLQDALDAKAASDHNHDTAYAAKTHTHAISDITNLQSTLNGKAASSHSHSNMKAATASAAGSAGMVPAPAAGDQNKVLSGAGTWVSQTAAYTHPTSGVTAGTYKSVTVNAQGHVTAGSNPTTLEGYGITDAAAKTHTHAISDITNLQSTLNGKAASSHSHSTMTGASASAAGAAGFVPAPAKGDQAKVLSGAGTWVAQTAAYSHPTSGVTAGTYRSVTVNAQGHVTAGTNPTTLGGYGITDAAAKSHTHTIANVTNLQTTLDGKAAKSHTHTISDISDFDFGVADEYTVS